MVPFLGHPGGPEQPAHTLSLGHTGSRFLPEPGIQRAYPIVWESLQLHLSRSSEEARSYIPKFSYYGKCISLEEIFPVSAVHLIVKMNRVTSVQTTGSIFKNKK